MKPVRSFAALAMLVGIASAVHAETADKPNIVILFADDMGYADTESYGNPYIRTPNIDRLAREGQRWTDFYVASPVCSPSRGALLTGKLPVKSGLYGRRMRVMHPGDTHGIPAEELTMAEALRAAGYRTGIFGKWHLGDAPDNYPTRNGFDDWYGIPYSNDMDRVGSIPLEKQLELMKAGRSEEPAANYRKTIELFKDPKVEYWNVPLYRSRMTPDGFDDSLIERPVEQPTLTRRLTEEAIRFIEDNAGTPFLVYVPYSMPHLPLFRSEAFAGRSLRGRYGDVIEEIDWSVGRIREALERAGIADDTLVFFSSDNGPWISVSITGSGSAGMLRAGKGTTWEGGVRVPGIFWWPGQIEPGTVSGIGTTMDVFATVLRLAGAEPPDDIDGLDLNETLRGRAASPRTEMPFYLEGELRAYRKGRYKLHFITEGGYGDPKVTHEQPLLFDLHEDLSELEDIAARRPEILKDMLQTVARHRQQTRLAEPIFDMRLQQATGGAR